MLSAFKLKAVRDITSYFWKKISYLTVHGVPVVGSHHFDGLQGNFDLASYYIYTS